MSGMGPAGRGNGVSAVGRSTNLVRAVEMEILQPAKDAGFRMTKL
jgi:hypothetical protein